ncbi:MAG: HDIG domain-containing protein [Phycisphaerales bacterium]
MSAFDKPSRGSAARSTGGRGAPSRSAGARRREGLRRTLPKPVFDLRDALRRPEVGNCLVIGAIASMALGALLYWSLTTSKVAVGQIAADHRLVRSEYRVFDDVATKDKRDEARRGSPRTYVANDDFLARLRNAAERLPAAVAGRSGIDGVDQALVQEFGLTDTAVQKLQAFAPPPTGTRTEQWRRWVEDFFDTRLVQSPLLDPQDYQLFVTAVKKEARRPAPAPEEAGALGGSVQSGTAAPVAGGAAGSVAAPAIALRELEPVAGEATPVDRELPKLAEALARSARASGVRDPDLITILIAPLLRNPKPTLIFDEAETTRRADAAAAEVERVERSHPRGEVIYVRGDELSDSQVRLAREETERYLASMSLAHRALMIGGVIGLAALLIGLLSTYLLAFYPGICRRPVRVAAMFGLIVCLPALALAVAIQAPWTLVFVASGTTLFASMILTLAYDRRLAIFVASLYCLTTSLLLELGPAFFIALLCGSATMIVQLREVRHRTALIRASLVTAAVLGVGMALASFVRMTSVPSAAALAAVSGLWAAAASVATGFFMLGVLPTLERLCDITTGLTLAELRDPKQALLRQLQQRAPGTYNHSLQIANIAEAAAEAIGADGLLVYVGALYHDIGKMNKPEYFVENQGSGPNKHEKLSPAMSLLVIVGHVKDGVELAREYKLPRRIRHFIESHHGTTLVEWFFHAARTRAEAAGSGEESVEEIAYRYPGPKPQTREAAILMIADAVESASRAMTEPTPGRIEALVRKLSRKRLDDGQFDECDLTLRELTKIEDSITKSVCAIYHGRIAYPGAATPKTDAGAGTGARVAMRA